MGVDVAGTRERASVSRWLTELEHVPLQVNPPRDDEEEALRRVRRDAPGPQRSREVAGSRPLAVPRYTSAANPAATTMSQSSSADTMRSNGSEKTK